MNEPVAFRVADRVAKVTGDYYFEGVVVSIFWKRDGLTKRLVVEDDRGCCFIFNESQLVPVAEDDKTEAQRVREVLEMAERGNAVSISIEVLRQALDEA